MQPASPSAGNAGVAAEGDVVGAAAAEGAGDAEPDADGT